MWYNRLNEYLIKDGYINDPICPYVFIKKFEIRFAMIAIYVDDINLIGTLKELSKTVKYLKNKFDVKDLGKTKLFFGLEFEHKGIKILVHQSTYTEKYLSILYGQDLPYEHPYGSMV